MAKMVTFQIDGRYIDAEEGSNLVDAARQNDIFIPSLCYFQHHDPPLGTCRACMCKIDGRYVPACQEKVRANMDVQVNQAELVDMRKALVEMMFAEGNHFCPACEKSGDCDLQHMAYELNIATSRFPHLFKDRLIDYNAERIVLEHNRCIKCLRCVMEVITNDGKRVFSYANRGNETHVGIDYNEEKKLTEAQAEQAMKLCPTGAIILRNKSLSKPFGYRQYDLVSDQVNYGAKPIKRHPNEPLEKKVIATVSLAGCFGCHMSMLDIDTDLLDVVELVEFNKSPLTDIKEFTRRCHVGIIEGGCCNDENVETLRMFREKCDYLVSLGECAVWGGLPAMRNTVPLGECLEEAYLNAPGTDNKNNVIPYHEDIPKILDRVYACSEIVKIDYYIPGCPPSASHIWKAVRNLLWNEGYSILYPEFKYD